MPDFMDNNCPIASSDFEDDSKRTFSKFVKAGQLAFEGEEFCGIKICGKPFKSIENAFCGFPIEFLDFLGGGL